MSVLSLLLPAVLLLCAGLGAYYISPWKIPSILLQQEEGYAVLTMVRFPRVVLAALVGAALAISGACLQGLFRNPLAAPEIIGVSNGAAFGAAIWIVMFSNLMSLQIGLPIAAFLGGVGTVSLLWLVARSSGNFNVVTLILAGIAMNAIAGAGIGLMTFLSDDEQLRTLTFWLLGGFGSATWSMVLLILPFFGIGLFILWSLGSDLNAMSLGESEAFHLGVSIKRLRLKIIFGSALLVGSAVSVAGAIGFVGLVVPHLLRLWIGADHRWLLPASTMGGAMLLVLADLVARTVVIPAEMPVGIVTALVGGPFFLWLLIRYSREVLRGSL